MPTPASDFSSRKKQPETILPLRLFKFIQTCEELGLKVIFGEQSIEYFLFQKDFQWPSGCLLKKEISFPHSKSGRSCVVKKIEVLHHKIF